MGKQICTFLFQMRLYLNGSNCDYGVQVMLKIVSLAYENTDHVCSLGIHKLWKTLYLGCTKKRQRLQLLNLAFLSGPKQLRWASLCFTSVGSGIKCVDLFFVLWKLWWKFQTFVALYWKIYSMMLKDFCDMLFSVNRVCVIFQDRRKRQRVSFRIQRNVTVWRTSWTTFWCERTSENRHKYIFEELYVTVNFQHLIIHVVILKYLHNEMIMKPICSLLLLWF